VASETPAPYCGLHEEGEEGRSLTEVRLSVAKVASLNI
jgi:hypothetical protein